MDARALRQVQKIGNGLFIPLPVALARELQLARRHYVWIERGTGDTLKVTKLPREYQRTA